MKKWFWIGGIVIAVLLILGVVIHLINSGDKKPTLVTVKKGPIEQKVVATGDIVPAHAIQVKSQISGKVGKILKNEGDKVKTGQNLLVISSNATPDVIATNIANVKQAKATYLASKAQFARQTKLYKKQLISKQDYDAATSTNEVNASRYELARQQLDLLQKGSAIINGKQISNIIESPINGYILRRNVDVGDSIVPVTTYQAGTALFVIANMHDLIFKGEVSQIDVGKLKEGMSATLEIAALPKEKFIGKLSKISLQSIEAQNQQSAITGSSDLFGVSSDLQNGFQIEINGFSLPKDTVLRAGYQATATIVTKKVKDAIIVPEKVLHFDGDKVYVNLYVNKKIKKQYIELGISDNLNTQVVKGLKVKDEVVEG